jgi:hypothetical protein
MAIRDWHPGQLGVLWAGGLLLESGCIWVWSHTEVMREYLHPVPDEQGIYRKFYFTPPEEIIAHYVGVIGALALALLLLLITWKWFGSRNPPRES